VVVSALGLLNEPNVPELPGMDDFSGPMFHTGRWEPEHDLTGKRIAYIGVGSTAAQAIPSIAPAAAQVDVYQREAGWVVPKPMAEIGERQRARYRRWPLLMRIDRFKNFRIAESLAKTLEVGGPAAREFEAACLEALEETVEDEETRAALTPNHPFFCKRPVISSDYYPVFNRDNVDLITTSVRGFTTSGVIGKDGVEREADVVILSTGFKATSFLNSLEVFGRGGKSLHELWDERKGPEAFMGVAVPEFPNFFMLYGPNSNSASSSIIFVTECQAGFVIRSLKRMQRRGHDIIELRPLVMDVFERWLHERLSTTPWAVGSCHTYYRNEHGKVVTSWPGGGTHFWAMCRFTDRLAMTGRRKWRPEIRGGARRSTTTDREAEIPAAG
jgi:cation diffusion facilitator CzcD-associated flavoprotein CzcO